VAGAERRLLAASQLSVGLGPRMAAGISCQKAHPPTPTTTPRHTHKALTGDGGAGVALSCRSFFFSFDGSARSFTAVRRALARPAGTPGGAGRRARGPNQSGGIGIIGKK